MKISTDWLAEYVEIEESPQKLKDDLSMIGLLVEAIEELEDTSVLEVEVTSNRPDCLSHIGIARELAALYGRPLRFPEIRETLSAESERIPFEIEIQDSEICPRYTALVLDGVRVGESPEWMQRRLEAADGFILASVPVHLAEGEEVADCMLPVSAIREAQRMATAKGKSPHLAIEGGDVSVSSVPAPGTYGETQEGARRAPEPSLAAVPAIHEASRTVPPLDTSPQLG